MLVSHSPWWWIRVLPPGAGRDDRRIQPDRPDRVGRDRDRPLHVGVLADGRRALRRGHPRRHRPMVAADRVAAARLPSAAWSPTTSRSGSPPCRASALFDGPSPLQRAAALLGGARRRADVWIKREDLLPLAFGGNKLRNLEFLVGAALAEGADTLVTAGRRWSNHCRLTAAAGARAGLGVHLVLTGPPTDPPGPERAARRAARARRPRRRDRRRAADREALVAAGRRGSARRRPAAVRRPGRRQRARSARPDRCWPGSKLAGQADADRASTCRPSSSRRQRAGPRPACSPGFGRPGCDAAVVGVAVATPAEELRPTIAAILHGLVPLDRR